MLPAVLGLLHNPPARQDPPFQELSHRERQVLDLVAAGLGNQAISRRLAVSTKTVANKRTLTSLEPLPG